MNQEISSQVVLVSDFNVDDIKQTLSFWSLDNPEPTFFI